MVATMIDMGHQKVTWNITEAQEATPSAPSFGSVQPGLSLDLAKMGGHGPSKESISRPGRNSSHISETHVP